MAQELLKKHIDTILEHMHIKPSVSIDLDDETYMVKLDGEDLSFLIGRHGSSLQAFQTLLAQMIFNELNEWKHVVVDINGYRDSRKDHIEDMVRNFIDRVRFHKREVMMPSMNSFERRQVHMFVSDYPDIASESTGEGKGRHVVLKLNEGY